MKFTFRHEATFRSKDAKPQRKYVTHKIRRLHSLQVGALGHFERMRCVFLRVPISRLLFIIFPASQIQA